jgi:hypothetical protein
MLDLRNRGHKIGNMMLIRLEAGTAEPGVIGVAEVPICYGRALRGAGVQVVRLSGQLI